MKFRSVNSIMTPVAVICVGLFLATALTDEQNAQNQWVIVGISALFLVPLAMGFPPHRNVWQDIEQLVGSATEDEVKFMHMKTQARVDVIAKREAERD